MNDDNDFDDKKLPANFLRKSWMTISFLSTSAFFVLDIGSDVFLALRYWRQGDAWWSGLTATFVVTPWLLLALITLCCLNSGLFENVSRRWSTVIVLASACGMLPIAFKLIAWWELVFDGRHRAVSGCNQLALWVKLVVVLLESLPQLALQLYIGGYTNGADFFLVIAVSTSVASITMAEIRGGVTWALELDLPERSRLRGSVAREIVFALLFLPWCALQLTTFVPSVALLASMKGRSTPWYAAMGVYYVVHFVVSIHVSFTGTSRFARRQAGLFFSYSFFSRRSFGATFFVILSVLLQMMFCCVGLWAATMWFLNISKFAPEARNSYVRETILLMVKKVTSFSEINSFATFDVPQSTPHNATVYPWARCNVTVKEESASLYDLRFCMTRHAENVYLFVTCGALVLLVYHCLLVSIWRHLEDSIFPVDAETGRPINGWLEKWLEKPALEEIEYPKNDSGSCRQINENCYVNLKMELKPI